MTSHEQQGTKVRPTDPGEYEFRGYIDSDYSEGKDIYEFCRAEVFHNPESKRLNARVHSGEGQYWADYIGRFHGEWREASAPDPFTTWLRSYTQSDGRGYALPIVRAAFEAGVASMRAEVEALRRGEFICKKCFLRKDADASHQDCGF